MAIPVPFTQTAITQRVNRKYESKADNTVLRHFWVIRLHVFPTLTIPAVNFRGQSAACFIRA